MAWEEYLVHGGEAGDTAADVTTAYAASDVVRDTTAAYIRTGAGVLKFPTATSAAKATIDTRAASTLVGYIAAFSGSAGVSAQPGAGQIALLSDGVQGTTQRYVRIGNVGATDTKIRIYDKAGTLVLTSAASVPIAGNSPFVISFDGVNGVGGVYIKLYINGVEDGAVQTAISAANFFDTTKFAFWGEWLAAATNRGADMFLDDIALRRSPTATDALHLAAYPADISLIGGAALPPTAEGTYSEMVGTPDVAPNTWKDVGATRDYPNDGITSYVFSGSASKRQSYTYSAANPLPGGAIMVPSGVQLRAVYNLSGANKLGPGALLRRGGVDSSVAYSTPGTTFVGDVARFARPGGGSWVPSDFDLSAGKSTVEFGVANPGGGTIGTQVSEISGPELIFYTTTLPLGKSPRRRRRAAQII